MKNSILIFSFLSSFLLSGCNKTVTISELCDDNPKVCLTFTADTWCKVERKNLLVHYDLFNKFNTDDERYQVLLTLEKYESCMAIAAQIEHVKLKEKQENRIKNKDNAKKEIAKLVNESKQSTDPHMLYYRWSRFAESKAINQLLTLEGSNELETPELQLIFATYYTKRNPRKTLAYLFHALELYQPEDTINTEIFVSLSTLFTEKKEYKQTYIWLKILRLLEPKSESITEQNLANFAQQYQLNTALLNKVAKATLKKIQEGTFQAPSF